MDRAVFDRMEAQEDVHWWFAGRRQILDRVVTRLVDLPEDARILEAGCGTGGNLKMLQNHGRVRAFELDEDARQSASKKSDIAVAKGALPSDIPFEHETFDLIGLFDVLEHVEQDIESLAALASRLSPKGSILVTVPAFPWLWSKHDERHHHFRRYTRAHLRQVAAQAGLEMKHGFYFNTALFPVAVAGRALKTLVQSDRADDTLPPAFVNSTLKSIFGFERHLVGRVKLPVGLSLCAVLTTA